MRGCLIPVCALWCLSMVVGAQAADAAVGGATVIVNRATRECFSSTVRATGYIVPRATAAVMFNAPGFRIAEVSAKAGDVVKSGDQMAMAVPASQPLSASDSPASIASRIPIVASASGTVLRSTAQIGAPTSAKADPLFVIAVDSKMEALIDIPSVHVLELNAGQSARVTSETGRSIGAHVRVVPLEVNRVSQIGQARIAIDSDKPLEMGLFVQVAIDASRSCGIGVPRAALINESDGVRLQIVKDNTIGTRLVTLGLLNDRDAEVTEGLSEGELVVSDAGTSLRDGDKVRPVLSDLNEVR